MNSELNNKKITSKKVTTVLKKLLFMELGAAMYAMGVAWFLAPLEVVSGGVTGLSVLLNILFPMFEEGGTGIWMFMINLPLFVLSFFKLGFKFSLKTLVSAASCSLFTEFFERFVPAHGIEILPCIIIAGILMGAGIGLTFKSDSCLGGTDIIVKVLRLKFKFIKSGTFFLFVDGAIILLGGIVLWNFNNLVWAIICLFIQSYMTDFVLYGQDGAKMIYIITTKDKNISKRITEEVRSGVTYLHGTGAYTGNEKQIIMCAMRKQLLPKAKDIVLEEDPGAFMIVTSATQVWGMGYKSLAEKEL